MAAAHRAGSPHRSHAGVMGVVLIVIAVVCLLASVPCLLGAALGLMGVLADVGTQENRQMGFQALAYAAIPLGLCVLSLLVGLALRRAHARTQAGAQSAAGAAPPSPPSPPR